MFDSKKSLLQKVGLQILNNRSVNLFIKRDDLIDDFVSGNKWRKLKYNIQNAQLLKKEGILTFGGACNSLCL